MKLFTTRFAAFISTTITLGLALHGCRTGQGSGGGGTDFRGTVTVTNQSGLRVCSVEPDVHLERFPAMAINTELAPGASATFSADTNFNRVQIMECETNRLLYGDPQAYLNDRQTNQSSVAGQITLLAPGESAPSGGTGWFLPLEPLDVADATRHFAVAAMSVRNVPEGYTFMQDAELAGRTLGQMQTETTRRGWTERYTFAMVIGSDWRNVMDRRVVNGTQVDLVVARAIWVMLGAHHSTGHCSIRGQEAQQPFDGDTTQGESQLGGIGNVEQIPCSLLDAMVSQPGATGASSD